MVPRVLCAFSTFLFHRPFISHKGHHGNFSEVHLGLRGDKTHPLMGLKSGPGMAPEGGMQKGLVNVPRTTPPHLTDLVFSENSCEAFPEAMSHLSQAWCTPFV